MKQWQGKGTLGGGQCVLGINSSAMLWMKNSAPRAQAIGKRTARWASHSLCELILRVVHTSQDPVRTIRAGIP